MPPRLSGRFAARALRAQFAAIGGGAVALVAGQRVAAAAWTAARPATAGTPSTRARVRVTSLTLAAVVMTLSGLNGLSWPHFSGLSGSTWSSVGRRFPLEVAPASGPSRLRFI